MGEQLGGGFGGGEAGFRLLFLTGEFADNPSALGVAVNAATAAIFTEKIAGAAGSPGTGAASSSPSPPTKRDTSSAS